MAERAREIDFVVASLTLGLAKKRPTMQVRICFTDPPIWHRPMLEPNRARTECNEAIPGYYAHRPESYAIGGTHGELCKKGCFSPHVLRLAEELKNAAIELRMIEDAKLEAEREELARQWEEKREKQREAVRLFKTGDTAPLEKPEPEKDE